MLVLPNEIMTLLSMFAPVFSEQIFEWVKVLVGGSVLSPNKRTVTAALRVMGLSEEGQYQNYHRVLSRGTWSDLTVGQILLGQLVATFAGLGGQVVLGADETLERRSGKHIRDKECSAMRYVRVRSG